MKLELTLEEARVLDVAVEYIKRHKDVAQKIKMVNATEGLLRSAYPKEKHKLI